MTSLQNRATTQLITHGRDRTQAILEPMNQLAEERHRALHQAILGPRKDTHHEHAIV